MNQITYFEIQATDPEKLIDFYRQVFSWNFDEQKGLPVRYWRIETVGISGGLLQRPAQTPPTHCGTNAYTCSMQVADFDSASEKILANGGQIAMPKFEVPGRCWQGYFIDPDNNVFGLVQIIE